MRGKILTALVAMIISTLGISNLASAAPITGVTAEDNKITISFTAGVVQDGNTFDQYAPIFDAFAADLDAEKITIENVTAENKATFEILPGALKAAAFEAIDQAGDKNGVYRYRFEPTEIRVEFRAWRNEDGSYDYTNQAVQVLTTKDEHLAEQAHDKNEQKLQRLFFKQKKIII